MQGGETTDPSTVELLAPAPGGDAAAEAQRHTFTFDRVFGAGAGQGAVFEEVSQLVQSALDGYRVCIFAVRGWTCVTAWGVCWWRGERLPPRPSKHGLGKLN